MTSEFSLPFLAPSYISVEDAKNLFQLHDAASPNVILAIQQPSRPTNLGRGFYKSCIPNLPFMFSHLRPTGRTTPSLPLSLSTTTAMAFPPPAAAAATAILIVNGAYFTPAMWTPFHQALQAAGFSEVRHPPLPTCGDPTGQKTASDDAAVVRSAARDLVAAGHAVLVLAHSYGGIVASNAVTPDLYAASSGGGPGGVVAMCYVAAFVLMPGLALAGVGGKYGVQSLLVREECGNGRVKVVNSAACFYNDLPAERVAELVAMEVPHNTSVRVAEAELTPWKDLKTTYVLCEQDKSISPVLQEAMVKDASGAGGELEVVRMDTGHCPFYSKPSEMVEIIKQAAGKK